MQLFLFVVALSSLDHVALGVGSDEVAVSVMEGDSVTLHTRVETNRQDNIIWYLNNTRIAQISGDLSFICLAVECNKGAERFRDRLKLHNQTGSLTITNTRTTDSGDYKLKIINHNNDSEKTFSVSITDAPAAKLYEIKEGQSVTFDPGVIKHPNDLMTWYFNDTLIAEITGDQSEICADDQCKERFRDRLKLDQTGSLTITNTRNTDAGLYQLQIIIRDSSFSISRVKRFSVSVADSGLSSGAVAGIVIVVLLVTAVAAAVFYCRHRSPTAVPQNVEDDDDDG